MEELATLLEYVQADGRVCPMPLRWNELWEMLPGRTRRGSGWEPGPPLILAVWWSTSAGQKRERLREQIEYAARTGVLTEVDRFLRALGQSDWACERDF